jgi:hypothetical protein
MGLFGKKETKTEANVKAIQQIRGDVGELAWQFQTNGGNGEMVYLRFKDKALWMSITPGKIGTVQYEGKNCVGWQE